MKRAIKTKTCPSCRGAGHFERDGIRGPCLRCNGTGEVCRCCSRPLHRCRHNARGSGR